MMRAREINHQNIEDILKEFNIADWDPLERHTIYFDYCLHNQPRWILYNSNHGHILTSKKSSNSTLLAGDYATKSNQETD